LTQHSSLASFDLTSGLSVPICHLLPGESVLHQGGTVLSSSLLLLLCKMTGYGLNARFRGQDFSLQRHIQRLRPTELVYTESSKFLLQRNPNLYT
jgi:hypothetical protein